MTSRFARCGRRSGICNANIDTLIERIKKIRALNCNPSDIGIDSFVSKKWNSMCTSRYSLKKL